MGDATRQVGDRIEQLLVEVRAMVPPAAMERVDELVRNILSLYGSGLERVMTILDDHEANELIDCLVSDRLLASLLVLHGLHPLGLEELTESKPDRDLVQIGKRPEART